MSAVQFWASLWLSTFTGMLVVIWVGVFYPVCPRGPTTLSGDALCLAGRCP